jgi:hypothetical protein
MRRNKWDGKRGQDIAPGLFLHVDLLPLLVSVAVSCQVQPWHLEHWRLQGNKSGPMIFSKVVKNVSINFIFFFIIPFC